MGVRNDRLKRETGKRGTGGAQSAGEGAHARVRDRQEGGERHGRRPEVRCRVPIPAALPDGETGMGLGRVARQRIWSPSSLLQADERRPKAACAVATAVAEFLCGAGAARRSGKYSCGECNMSGPDFYHRVQLLLKPRNRREEENCREIADHLLQEYEEALQNGESRESAEKRSLSGLQAPSELRRRIRRAQGVGTRRLFSTVLFPGVVMTAVVVPYAFVFENLLGFRPQAHLFWNHAAFVYYWYMMPGFFVGAALATWYSRRRGANVPERLMAGCFLALASFAAVVLPTPLALAIDPHVPWLHRFETLTGYLLSQVIVPGIPMLLGALPFLLSGEKQIDDEETPAVA